MKTAYLIGMLLALILLISTVSAYSGFNRYYYTNTYGSSVYYPTPAYTPYTTYNSYSSYTYPTYYTSYYPTYYSVPTVYPTYGYTYAAPAAYINPYRAYGGSMSYYDSSGWGISVGYGGSMCGYYGYC